MTGAIGDYLKDDLKRTALFVTVAGISLVVSFFLGKGMAVDPAWVAIILCGSPIVYEAVTGLVFRHDIKADVLVAIAIVASIIMQEWFAAGEVAFIMELGGLLEDISADRSRAGIERLVSMVPSEARVIRDGSDRSVPASEVSVGDIVRVLPGEMIPLDGVIITGNSYVDQSSLTGESVPVAKKEDDEVYSGTINQLGMFDMRVTSPASESSFQKLVDMVESTDAEKTRIVRIADRWATYLVAGVFLIALAAYLYSGELTRALTVMIVFCPCAFILATPTAVVASIGNLSKHGILVRDGDALEKMARADRIVFDKTGTLTEGRPRVTGIETFGGHEVKEVAILAASAEKASEHPYARAILEFCDGKTLSDPVDADITVGGGISAFVEGRHVMVGNAGFVGAENDKDSDETEVYVSVDSEVIGRISISDAVREGSVSAVSRIRDEGAECLMLTGDSEGAASSIARTSGITEYVSGCRPDDKLACIRRLRDEGHTVCMIGDGINDAPSLKAADVGIAMGGTGSGITIDVADMVIVGDEVARIPHLMHLSKKMLKRIKINIVFAMGWNLMAVAMAFMGVVEPVAGAIIHNVGSVAVVVSSFLLLFTKEV